jgi:carbamoylphosphate synthase small subunit
VKVTHKSLFDGSLQGIERTDRPAFSFQGHPEASPGPQDVGKLFEKFVAMIHDRLSLQLAAAKQGTAGNDNGRRAAEG